MWSLSFFRDGSPARIEAGVSLVGCLAIGVCERPPFFGDAVGESFPGVISSFSVDPLGVTKKSTFAWAAASLLNPLSVGFAVKLLTICQKKKYCIKAPMVIAVTKK